jgi:acyl-CoA synthetase (NDP forming)
LITQHKSVIPELDFLFHPQSIAVVGVSMDKTRINGGRWLLDSLLSARFPGKLYPVGLERGEYAGLPIYRSVKDIPGRLDYVIVAIPAAATLQLARDAAAKGAKALHLFTAGFSELGGDGDKQLERQLVEFVREKGMRLLGPNCMGIYYPGGRLAFFENVSNISGHFGLISQSGGNGIKTIRLGPRRGLFFSKAVSYGNGADINETDLLEYFTADPETKVIGMYIEGTRDGRRCFSAIRQAARTKPVIIYKGGNTEIGRSATLSHTGSLAGSGAVWSGVFKQAGAIEVNDMDEMIDLALLFAYTVPSAGTNTAIIGLGGGAGVLIADTWARAGLTAPIFPAEIREQLKAIFVREAGRSVRNPIDVVPFTDQPIIAKTIAAVTGWGKIDYVLVHLALGFTTEPLRSQMKTGMAMLTELPEAIRRRILVLIHEVISPEDRALAGELEQICRQVGLPVFHSPRGVALALSRYAQYNQKISKS